MNLVGISHHLHYYHYYFDDFILQLIIFIGLVGKFIDMVFNVMIIIGLLIFIIVIVLLIFIVLLIVISHLYYFATVIDMFID